MALEKNVKVTRPPSTLQVISLHQATTKIRLLKEIIIVLSDISG